jgi:hypothetical protein
MTFDANREDSAAPSAEVQEAIDAAAAVYAGDAGIDVEQALRTELRSRGLDASDDAWISDVAEGIRRGRKPEVGEHDGSVEARDDGAD